MKTQALVVSDLTPIADPGANPGRGWYRMFTFDVSQPPVFQEDVGGACCALALVRLWLGAYQNQPLDERAMANLAAIFDGYRQRGMDMILRPTYDIEGRGLEHEPATVGLVETHLRQLGEAASPYANSILLLQGVLLGSWGEMHASKFLTRPQLERLMTAARQSFPESIFLAVRQGAQWRTLCSREKQSAETRMGLFNDALFGSETDLGTYGTLPAAEVGWQGQWTPEEERAFIREMHSNRPFGGETAFGEEKIAPTAALEALSALRATYLSCEWDARVLDAWRAASCGKGGLWQNASVYDYIGAHLGYRLVVRDCRLHAGLLRRQLTLRLRLANEGFAPVMQLARAALVVTGEDGAEAVYPLKSDLRALAPGAHIEWSQALPPRARRLCLRVCRACDGRPIRLAHKQLMPNGDLLLAEMANEP